MPCQSSPHSEPHIAVVAGQAAAVSGLFVCFHTAPLSQASLVPTLPFYLPLFYLAVGHATTLVTLPA